MDETAILTIGGVVGTLSKFLMMGTGLKGRWATLASALVATLAVGVWGYDAGDFARDKTWEYFAGWAATLMVAAGFFHTTEEAVKKVAGTGDGRVPALLLAAALGSGVLVIPACGANVPPIQPLPAATESIDQDVKAFAVHALSIMELAGNIANDASKVAVTMYPSVPPAARARVDEAFLALSKRMRTTNQRIRDGAVTTWPALKAEVDPVLKDLQTVVDSVKAAGPNVWRRVGTGLMTALSLVLAATGPGVPQ